MGKHGVITTYKDLEHLTVGQALERSARIVPNKVCVSFKDDRITYEKLNQQSNAIAAVLQETGIRKGDRVAIYMSNCPELYFAFYGLQKIGAIVAWANPAYKTKELSFILGNSQAKAVFVQKGGIDFDRFDLVQALRGDLPHLSSVISLQGADGEGVFAFDELISRGKKKEFTDPAIDIHRDLSMFIYTSGTTGVPKGSMITHFQVVRGGYSYVDGVRATADDIFMGVLPLTHSYGCGSTLIQPVQLAGTGFGAGEKSSLTIVTVYPAHTPTVDHGIGDVQLLPRK